MKNKNFIFYIALCLGLFLVITASIIENPPLFDTHYNPVNPYNEQNLEDKININYAVKSELMNLRGIGEAKAQAIIDYRTQNGKFKSIEDIKNVKGIGEKLFSQIKDKIEV